MPRRLTSLLLSLLLVLLFVLVDVVANLITSGSARRWSLPLLGVTVVLLVAVTVWQYLMDHPGAPKRAWTAERPPYPGLEAFTEQDAAVFFGREPQIAELVDRLHPTLPRNAHRFVAVVGPSGAGKSSLVQAGLLPRLAQRRGRWTVVPPLLPADDPTRSLADSLAVPEAQLAEGLRAAGGGLAGSVLVVIDQAEELLTLTGAKERDAFLGLLRDALAQDPKLWVVATLRSEFLTGFLETDFADLFEHPLAIGTLGRAALSAVIEGPAAQAGLEFAPDLVQRMVDDTGGGDALPLLAYTLQALYLRVGSGGTVTEEDYRQLGGVAGTLSRQADKVTAELRTADPDVPVVDTLLKFVTLDGTEPTRRRVQRQSLGDAEREVVDAFIAARLLASDEATVQVAHEALFRRWAPLAQAIEARADELRQRAELERWAVDWDRSGRRDSYLLAGERLATAQQWTASHSELVTDLPLVRELLDRSTRADRAALERLSEAIARQALAGVDQDPEHSLLLALTAIEECAPTLIAQRALVAALAASQVSAVLCGHKGAVEGVAWSPDGRRLATASRDQTARIWDAGNGSELLLLRGHKGPVESVAWSPDGRRLATASGDRTARIWDGVDGSELLVLGGHENHIWGVKWSADGRRLATASRDQTARIWDAGNGSELLLLRGHKGPLESVAWPSDGRRLATASGDRTARIWDGEDGSELFVLCGHKGPVRGVAWSPDGRRLATASVDRTVRVWDAEHGEELLVFRGHEDRVIDVVWSPDGRRLATASVDRTVRVWDAKRGEELLVLRGQQDWPHAVAWSPDGLRLATGSDDRTARIWEAEQSVDLAIPCVHQDSVCAVAWSPDGRHLVTGSDDRTARVWDAEHGEELLVLRGHENQVWGVAWSPDGQRLATASHDRTARVWDVEDGSELLVLRGHQDILWGVAWSPDGRRLATASGDWTARVWDAERGSGVLALRGHEESVRRSVWSSDGQRLATASHDQTARVWDAEHGVELLVLFGHEDFVLDVAWSPDGGRLVTGSDDRTARVWDAGHGEELLVLFGHEGPVEGVAWSPDGQYLVTVSGDRTARIWDAERGTELAIPCVHKGSVFGVAWSPDGKRLATASQDRTVRIWEAFPDIDALVAKARKRVFHQLTDDERRKLMLPERV